MTAQRLVPRTIVPMFVYRDSGRSKPLGSCVFMRVDGYPFIATAGDVVDAARGQDLHIGGWQEARKALGIPASRVFRSTGSAPGVADCHDVAVIPIGKSNLRRFFRGAVFLDAGTIDAADEPDLDHLAVRGYFVVGYPAARSHPGVSLEHRPVHHTSFQLTAFPAGPSTYATKGLDRGSHLLLEYDRKAVFVDGVQTHPPRLQGISGGAILRFSSLMPEFRLVAIGTEHRKQTRAIVGTRIGQVLTLAREVIRSGDPKLFE